MQRQGTEVHPFEGIHDDVSIWFIGWERDDVTTGTDHVENEEPEAKEQPLAGLKHFAGDEGKL
jgi:hypothetical protein